MIDTDNLSNHELDVINNMTSCVISHRILQPRHLHNTVSVRGTVKTFQTLIVRGLVSTTHVGDVVKNKHYWFTITPNGLNLIENLVKLKEL